jgi:hypothetical protein
MPDGLYDCLPDCLPDYLSNEVVQLVLSYPCLTS